MLYVDQQLDQQRPIPSYQSLLLSELAYSGINPTDNYPKFPAYGGPYTPSYIPVGNQYPIYSNSPSLSSYIRPYNSAYLNLHDLSLNPDIFRQLYASQLYPRLRPQNLDYFSQFHTRLGIHPLLKLNGIIRHFNNIFYNSLIGKLYNNLKNIRNGPVTIFVESKEDPTNLDAIFVEQGLESLGKC